jgi:DNA-binding NarL/FixJ family response regulator
MIVFIVEDSMPMIERLTQMLGEVPGIEVAGSASDRAGAMEAIRRLRPDAVILDIRLRHGSGIDVLRAIRSEQIPSMVIVFTNYPSAQYRVSCFRLGADHFFDKSTEFERLRQLFETLVAVRV